MMTQLRTVLNGYAAVWPAHEPSNAGPVTVASSGPVRPRKTGVDGDGGDDDNDDDVEVEVEVEGDGDAEGSRETKYLLEARYTGTYRPEYTRMEAAFMLMPLQMPFHPV